MSKESPEASSHWLSLNSRFFRMLLIVLAALLTFAGPTYGTYVLIHVSHKYYTSMGVGIILFVTGLTLVWFLIKKKILS
jgi:cytochrome c biogenesis protein CcdA